MITSMFGNEIRIEEYDAAKQLVTAIRLPDGETRQYAVSTLKADGGSQEIMEACDQAEQRDLEAR